MGDVFGRAELCIAAHCAIDGSYGFLTKSMAKRDAVNFTYQRDGINQTISVCRNANIEVDVTDSQLCTRGWVLPERLLAAKTIHFTEGQLFYESSAEALSENGHLQTANRGEVNSRFGPSATSFTRGALGLATSATISSARGNWVASKMLAMEWLSLVEMYSSCDLTHSGDKLMAIAGMAQKIHRNLKTPYAAGIWNGILKGCSGWPSPIPMS